MSALSSRRVDNMSVTADLNTHERARARVLCMMYGGYEVNTRYALEYVASLQGATSAGSSQRLVSCGFRCNTKCVL